MNTNYILIDYENVQPDDLEALHWAPDQDFRVLLFVGVNQPKIPVTLADPMQRLHKNAEYIVMNGSGKNALDFHIAYYLGQLSKSDPEAYFHVIAKDRDYDLLINHMKSKRYNVEKRDNIAAIPLVALAIKELRKNQVNEIIKHISSRGDSRPKRVKTLKGTIKSWLTQGGDDPDEEKLDEIVKDLQNRKYVVIDENEKVQYQPSGS